MSVTLSSRSATRFGRGPMTHGLTGLHPIRGPMALDGIIQRFIVAHLEEHADQLDAIPDA